MFLLFLALNNNQNIYRDLYYILGFPGGTSSKELLALLLGGGQGNPFQYSCLKNLKDRGTWWIIVHAGTKSLTEETEHTCIITS